jgi:glycosyltransferase involved in cell wall biosynthesis
VKEVLADREAGFAALLLARVFRKPVVVSARGSDVNQFADYPVIRWCLRYTLSRATRVIAVCQALKEAMIRLGIPGEKISVIPNGVDCGTFHPLSKDEARRRLGLTSRTTILSVGGLIPRKGFDLLIKALKILLDEVHQKELFLISVGEGPYRNELEKLVSSLHLSEHVRFVGAVPHQELYVWYNAADLFCLASSREGWPNVILESLACGTPVVATDIWGVPEIICSDEVGLLMKRDEHSIAETISRALKIPWRAEALVEYAKGHTWNKAARSIAYLFDSILDGRGGVSHNCGSDKGVVRTGLQK